MNTKSPAKVQTTEQMIADLHSRLAEVGDLIVTNFHTTILAQAADNLLIFEVNKRLGDRRINQSSLETEVSCDCNDDDDVAGGGVDMPVLEEAAARFRRGEYREMLWQLEKALGADFAGLSDLSADKLS